MSNIYHPAKITSVKNGIAYIAIERESACGTCKNTKTCISLQGGNQVWEVPIEKGSKFSENQRVTLVTGSNSAKKAVWWGYVFPFLVLMSALVVFSNIVKSELITAILCFSVLAVYYFCLYLFRDSLKNNFKIRILPLE